MKNATSPLPYPSPERLMGQHRKLINDGFLKILSAWPDPETGKLDMSGVDSVMSDLENELGTANVASVNAVFDKDGYIKEMDEVVTIYARDRQPRLF